MRDLEAQAAQFLDTFAQYTDYQHGEQNPYLARLNGVQTLSRDRALEFLCIWYSFSRRTPQILLSCAAAYPDQPSRKQLMANYLEEDGLTGEGHEPHYDLLVHLIEKMGGTLVLNERAESIIEHFMSLLPGMSEARATGFVSGFEHPALDITLILMEVVKKAGFPELLDTDPYLRIHVQVEPSHIIWAHGKCLPYIRDRHTRVEAVRGFTDVMGFWRAFWNLAFERLMPTPVAA